MNKTISEIFIIFFIQEDLVPSCIENILDKKIDKSFSKWHFFLGIDQYKNQDARVNWNNKKYTKKKFSDFRLIIFNYFYDRFYPDADFYDEKKSVKTFI